MIIGRKYFSSELSIGIRKLKNMKSKIIFSFYACFILSIAYSQNKKEQIEILNNRVDSLNSILISDRNTNNQKEIEYKELMSTLQIQVEDSNKELLKKSIEIKVLENDEMEKENLISELTKRVDELKMKLEQQSLNSKIEIIDAPSFSISNPYLIKITDSKMINPCPEMEYVIGSEICKKEVTRITYFKKGNVTRLFACVGYSYDGCHYCPGQNGFVLAEYKNSNWTIIDFLQCHDDDGGWGNSFEIRDQFLLGKNSFAYNCSSCNGGFGYDSCEGFIVGFIDDKISVLLQGISEENNQASGEEPIIAWQYNYKPISSDNQLFELERKYYGADKPVETKILKYNSQSMKFE